MKVERVVVYNAPGGQPWHDVFYESVQDYCGRHGLELALYNDPPGFNDVPGDKGNLRKFLIAAAQTEPFLYVDTDVWIAPGVPAPPDAVSGKVLLVNEGQPWRRKPKPWTHNTGVMVAPGGGEFDGAVAAMFARYAEFQTGPGVRMPGDQWFINKHCDIEAMSWRWNVVLAGMKEVPPLPSPHGEGYFYHAVTQGRNDTMEARIKRLENWVLSRMED